MSDLRELYQEIIIDHGRRPRNFGELADANCHKEGFNPLCGDKIILHVAEHNGRVEKIMFEGAGCAISMASASLMTEYLKGKTIQDVDAIFTAFHDMVTNNHITDDSAEKLGKLMVLGGVSEFPVRVKCATLAWHTLKAALYHDPETITTEDNV
jgi:nitrogen fixation NifU-like protein